MDLSSTSRSSSCFGGPSISSTYYSLPHLHLCPLSFTDMTLINISHTALRASQLLQRSAVQMPTMILRNL